VKSRLHVAAREVLGADLRSLALLRIGLALCVLLDLAGRACDLRAHYTDAGILSRADAITLFGFLHALPLCVHLAGGSTWSAALLFAVAAVAAAALLVGYRARAASAVSWLLTASVQLRNPYIGAGWDALLRMLLLWGAFLPLGACWSLDATDGDAPADRRTPVFSAGSVALLAQMAIVYAIAGYTKWQEPAWRDGSALAAIFADDFTATALGSALARSGALLAGLTLAVPWLEMAGSAGLFVPVWRGPTRCAAVAVLAGMTALFGLCLSVGLFPLVALAGLAGLLPGWFWGRPIVARWIEAPLDRVVTALRRRLPTRPGRRPGLGAIGEIGAQGACALLVAYLVFWAVGVARSPVYRAPESVAWLGESLFLQQDWRMFSVPPSQTGAVEVSGRLRDGTPIDLLAAGGPVPQTEIAPAPRDERRRETPFRSVRWRLLLWRATDPGRSDQRLLHYGRYLCREWNQTHPPERSLATFEVIFWARPVGAPAESADRRVLWSHDCFG
jgi:vitamin K-dependent gamma-carboxylase-like protein